MVNLETLKYSTNKIDYKSITDYKLLEEFLKDYNSYKLYTGGTTNGDKTNGLYTK